MNDNQATYGYLINIYKYAPVHRTWLKNGAFINRQNGQKGKNVIWSSFDRMEVRQIEHFREFRESTDSEKNWFGERQFMMLYTLYEQIKERSRLRFQQNAGRRFPFVPENKKDTIRFFGVSVVDFSPEAHYNFYKKKENVGAAIRSEMLKALDAILENNQICSDRLCFDVYGSLSSNDLVIIWLAYDFNDILCAIEALRSSHAKYKEEKIAVVGNVFTILGFYDIDNQNIDYTDIKGQINIRLMKRSEYNQKEFLDAFKQYTKSDNPRIRMTVGEYDISCEIEGGALTPDLYKKLFLIDERGVFGRFFLQAATEFTSDYVSNGVEPVSYEGFELQECCDVCDYNDKQKVNCDLISEVVDQEEFFVLKSVQETLWLLYEEYIKNISSVFSYPWTEDLHFQFKASLDYIKKIISFDGWEDDKTKKWNCINFTIKNLQKSMMHISQSNRMFFEVPNVHLYYTGAYSKILRAYMGIAKQLIESAYVLNNRKNQSILVPFLTFDNELIINSEACPEVDTCRYEILNIHLPYDALTNIPLYSRLLAHEIYHYIAPEDRGARNKRFGKILMAIYIEHILTAYLKDNLENPSQNLKSTESTEKSENIRNHVRHLQSTIINVLNTRYENLVEPETEKSLWNDYYMGNIENFKERMNEDFAKNVCQIINESLASIVKEPVGNQERIIPGSISEDDFVPWLVENIAKLVEKNKLLHDVRIAQFALREGLADYFMMQSTEMSMKDYVNQMRICTNIVGNRPYHNHRMGILLDYILKKSFGNITKKDLATTIQQNFGFRKKESESISEMILEARVVFGGYWGVIERIFDDIDFSKKTNVEKPVEKMRGILGRAANSFEISIELVESFQCQQPLENLYENASQSTFCGNIGGDNNGKFNNLQNQQVGELPIPKHNLGNLINEIKRCIERMTDGQEKTIWFRGHSSTEYKLIPKLYRIKDKKEQFYGQGITPRDVFESLYSSFRAKAFGAPEIFAEGMQSKIGIMATMQHYSVPTNILDWSISALTAIYFAVKDGPNEDGHDAEIWILDPERLNQLGESNNNTKYPVPSLIGDEEEYNAYFPLTKRTQSASGIQNYPKAIYTPAVNQRIKAQGGTFTVFSLDENIDDSGKLLEYELYKLQMSKGEDLPFLDRVRIKSSRINAIAKELKLLGIKTSGVYPELEKIAEGMTEEHCQYWENIEGKFRC